MNRRSEEGNADAGAASSTCSTGGIGKQATAGIFVITGSSHPPSIAAPARLHLSVKGPALTSAFCLLS